MTLSERKAALRVLGFRTDTRKRYRSAVRCFQRAVGLPVTGVADPATRRALRNRVARNRSGRPDLSKTLSFSDFLCKCGGRYSSCRRAWPRRRLIVRLEKMRAKVGRVRIVSGCRCPGHNRDVGGASASQHVDGRAADLDPWVPASRIINLGLFTGVGTVAATGMAAHVDVRPSAYLIRWFYR